MTSFMNTMSLHRLPFHLLPPTYASPLTQPFHRNQKTRAPFKPKSSSRGSSSYQLRQYAEQTLGSGSLRKVVKLPEGEDVDEWLAVNGGFW
jgi:Mob1/phocein family